MAGVLGQLGSYRQLIQRFSRDSHTRSASGYDHFSTSIILPIVLICGHRHPKPAHHRIAPPRQPSRAATALARREGVSAASGESLLSYGRSGKILRVLSIITDPSQVDQNPSPSY
jgi:hypothetical protein